MNIKDIEDAVDRIISKREQNDCDQPEKIQEKPKIKQDSQLCPECEKRKRMKKQIVHTSKSKNHPVICPGRHSDIVDSLVSSKKNAM